MSSWESFFEDKIKLICADKKRVIDIGGGLRAFERRGVPFDPRRASIVPFLKEIEYKIMDPLPDYDSDIVGDIHAMPFPNNSEEAIICNTILEHVENPIQACKEVYRVLKPGGYALFYLPFLFYYHAEPGHYKDYWRFSSDAVEMLFRSFKTVEVQKVRGALETWVYIGPFGRFKLLRALARFGDRLFKKTNSNQVSGHYVFCVK